MKRESIAIYVLSLLFGLGISSSHAAESYPSKPIQVIIGYATGGPTDVTGRVLAKELTEQLGTSVVVNNKTGGASLIGTKEVLRAANDGYTLLFASLGHNVNPILGLPQADYDPITDFEPISLVATQPLVMVTAYDSPYKTVDDVVEDARKNPEAVSFGSAGNGGSAHLAAELLKLSAGVEMLHVPFRGNAPALTEVTAGRVSFMFYPSVGIAEQVEAKRLRILAVGPSSGLKQFPDAPTMASLGHQGFDDAAPWVGLLAPKGTPQPIVDRLNEEMDRAMQKPEVRERLESLGNVVVGGTPQVFTDYLKRNTEKMTEIVERAKITVQQ